ncbi:hypothetical protein, partial [Escherichia coli]|uniref:hypothetical protein n=1 Tax=Escherichia coli TaxID=562 RepID=UPI001BB23A07
RGEDTPAHYADAIRYNTRTPLQGSLLQSSMARIFCSSVNMFHLLMSPGNRPHPHNGQIS